jgi:hypothetical protein
MESQPVFFFLRFTVCNVQTLFRAANCTNATLWRACQLNTVRKYGADGVLMSGGCVFVRTVGWRNVGVACQSTWTRKSAGESMRSVTSFTTSVLSPVSPCTRLCHAAVGHEALPFSECWLHIWGKSQQQPALPPHRMVRKIEAKLRTNYLFAWKRNTQRVRAAAASGGLCE